MIELPPCPTPCDGDCEADCHEAHDLDYKRGHQPWACRDIRLAMYEYAARMVEEYARPRRGSGAAAKDGAA